MELAPFAQLDRYFSFNFKIDLLQCRKIYVLHRNEHRCKFYFYQIKLWNPALKFGKPGRGYKTQ